MPLLGVQVAATACSVASINPSRSIVVHNDKGCGMVFSLSSKWRSDGQWQIVTSGALLNFVQAQALIVTPVTLFFPRRLAPRGILEIHDDDDQVGRFISFCVTPAQDNGATNGNHCDHDQRRASDIRRQQAFV
jgi:hypothetical protein